MIRSVCAGSLLGLALLAQPAAAQSRRVASHDRVPPGQLPPAGMCRVWIDGVPPGRQPRVTDCRTARYQAARSGGRVLYGDDYARPGKAKGKYKDHRDDRYGRRDRDRDDDRWDRRERDDDDRYEHDRDRDGRYGTRDNVCVDNNRDGRCDVTQSQIPGTIPGTSYPRGSTTQSGTTQRRQTVTERLDSLRRAEQEAKARRNP